MSRINALMYVAALAAGSAHAITIEELSIKQNELIGVRAELALAKAKQELAPYKPVAAEIAKNPHSSTPPLETEEVLGISGQNGALTADIQLNGVKLSRKRGEMAFNGWQIADIRKTEIDLVKRAKGKKDQHRTIRLATHSKQPTLSSPSVPLSGRMPPATAGFANFPPNSALPTMAQPGK